MNRLFAILLMAASVAASATDVVPAPYLTQPAPSPDGSEIAFVSGGDIWVVPARGGDAHLLVPGAAVESRPLYSPDGRRLAFVSTRTGNGDIHVLEFASGRVERITFDDGYDNLSAWSADGEWLYFSSARENVGGMAGVFRVRARGGTPMPVSREDYRNHEGAAPSPDGRELVLTGNGTGERQWWRHGHSHLEVGALWLLADDGHGRYRRITPDDARALWPMWSADGAAIWYMSDRDGAENLWRTTRDGAATQVTRFRDGRLLWPAISADGRTIAFARDFGLWRFDVASGEARPLQVRLRGAASTPAVERQVLQGDFSELAVSPDGKKLAFIARGEVFAASSENGGRGDRVTRTREAEFHLAWAPDSRRLVYASERGGEGGLYLHDFGDRSERALTRGKGIDARPQFSPDGKRIAFVRDGVELRVLDLASGPCLLAAEAAHRTQPGGLVLATDIAEGMLAEGARRCGPHPGLLFAAADAEHLCLADASMDRVLAGLALFIFPHPERALAEMHRVLVPGGRLALSVWGVREAVPLIHCAQDTIARLLPPPKVARPSVFRFGEPAVLEAALRSAGFDDIDITPCRFSCHFADAEAYWQAFLDLAGGAAEALGRLPEATQAALRAAVTEDLAAHRCDDGRGGYLVPALTLVASARRPG